MKNKYLTKLLCITMISVMVLSSGPMTAMAFMDVSAGLTAEEYSKEFENSEKGEEISDQEEPSTPTPEPGDGTETPTPTPEPGDGTETPIPTPTPEPGDGTETPTPTPDPTPSPVPGDDGTAQEKIVWIIEQLNALGEITLESESQLATIRSIYESLSEEDKALVTNYEILVQAEELLALLKAEQAGGEFEEEVVDQPDGFENEDTAEVQEGIPVYVTNAVSNLHAGIGFYLDSLKDAYHLEFAEDFADVMGEIEQEYKDANHLKDYSDQTKDKITSSKDELLVRNWQDILAVYVYQQKEAGKTEYVLNRNAKEDLAEIFAEMNPLVRDQKVITKVAYGDLHVNDYIKKHKISKKDGKFLKKYVETDCKLLCATVTAAKGFVRQSVGEDVSEERVNVITAAYSLVGDIGYFWGGKSSVLGWDPAWGSVAKVEADGSKTTGSLRAYGLDCSGFVNWAFNNGYWDTAMEGEIGQGTSDQWNRALTVREEEAQPGDLVFQKGPEAGSDNHVGIICGQTDNGDWIAVHCSSNKNGVTVGEAYSASFRYIRRPACFPTKEELNQQEQDKEVVGFSTVTEDDEQWKALLK